MNGEKKMSLELPGYREVLADLTAQFGQGAWISIDQIAKYDKSDPRTVKKRYRIPKGANGINRCILARRICELTR